jgi:hypothetical protein
LSHARYFLTLFDEIRLVDTYGVDPEHSREIAEAQISQCGHEVSADIEILQAIYVATGGGVPLPDVQLLVGLRRRAPRVREAFVGCARFVLEPFVDDGEVNVIRKLSRQQLEESDGISWRVQDLICKKFFFCHY